MCVRASSNLQGQRMYARPLVKKAPLHKMPGLDGTEQRDLQKAVSEEDHPSPGDLALMLSINTS